MTDTVSDLLPFALASRASSPPPHHRPSSLPSPLHGRSPVTTHHCFHAPRLVSSSRNLAPDPLPPIHRAALTSDPPGELISDPSMRFPFLFALQLVALAAAASAAEVAVTRSSRMVHRLSDEARLEVGPRVGWWPQRGSGEYYRALVRSDIQRQKRRLAVLSLSKGGSTFSPGNDLGWCASYPAAPLDLTFLDFLTVLLHCECYNVTFCIHTTRQ
jgi:hypothetical protein